MSPSSADEISLSGGKPKKLGKKDGKRPREEMPAPPNADQGTGILLRQMAADLATVTANLGRLQSDVDTLKQQTEPSPAPTAERTKKSSKNADYAGASESLRAALAGEPNIAVALAVPASPSSDSHDSPFVCTPDMATLSAVESAQVAKLGYAFSSVPKVALIRLLLDSGELTAAQLGEGAGLTTGSLYHHLRELVHAEVTHQSSRNRYALTDLGRRTALVLLALQV